MRKFMLALLAIGGVVFAKRQQEAKKDAKLWSEATGGAVS
ncbi:MAG: DLW-39 family protein [Cumulibacter sp.]